MADENEILKGAIKELGITNVAPEIYKDLLQPAIRELGNDVLIVAKAVSIALSPLKGAVWGFDKIQEWISVKLTEKLSKTSPEKIQTPKMNIAGQILLQLPFCKDESELREMYANLLASAMNKDLFASAHPSFVTIIQQLSPDEALVLKWISGNINKVIVVFEETDSKGIPTKDNDWIEPQFQEMCKSAGVSFPEMSDSYLDNLLRLKILGENTWSDIKFVPEYADNHGLYEASVDQEFKKEIFLTELGKKFIEICVK